MKKFLVLGGILATVIAGSVFARRTSPLFNMIFPPQDIFQPLAKKEVDPTRVGKRVQLEFIPKYPGNHELDLEVEKLEEPGSLKGKLVLSVVMKNKRNEQVHGKVRPYGGYWSSKSKGFPLLSFDVPRDIRIGEAGTVDITISTPDLEFGDRYGGAQLIVRKGSDE